MPVTVGSGTHRYELEEGWGRLPDGWALGQTGIATDSADRVYLFNRGDHPLIVLDKDGEFLTSWGYGLLSSAHGIFIDRDDCLYLPLMFGHVVFKFDSAGNLLQTLGTLGLPSNPDWWGDVEAMRVVNSIKAYPGYWRQGVSLPDDHPFLLSNRGPVSGAYGPFTIPTDVAVSSDGSIYVSDGYGNARVHQFSSDGQLIRSWGVPGDGAGEFWTPHAIWVHSDGRVFVADRGNDRIQVFTSEGEHLSTWPDLSHPQDIFVDDDDYLYLAEGASGFVSVWTLDGEPVTRWDGPTGANAHALWIDSERSLYVNQDDSSMRLLKYRRL